MIPDELVGVEVGSVTREEVELESSFHALDEFGHKLGNVSRVLVDNQEHRTATPAQEVLEELDESFLIESPGIDLVPKGSQCVQSRNGIDRLPPTTRRNLRGVSPLAPGPRERSVGSDAGFVEEEDVRAAAPG